MIKEGKFGTFEAVSLMTIILITKGFFTSIRVVIKTTGTAAWYTTLISAATSIILFLLVYLLMKRFPGKNLVEVFDRSVGKILGKAFSLIFCAYLIYYAGSNLREFMEMLKAYMYPYTQPSVILFAFMLAVVTLSYIGLEGIVRVSAICFIPIIAGLCLILFLAYPYYRIDYLFPLEGFGISKTLYHGITRSSAYSDIIILAFVINSIHGIKNFKKAGLISLILSGLALSISILCDIMAFAYSQGSENVSSLFQLSRMIYFSRFFQRVESIFLFIWVIASVITVAAGFYTSVSIFCKAFNVSNHKPLLLPAAYLTIMISLLPKNLSEVSEVNITFLRQYSAIITYGIPIFALIISLVLGKKGEKIKDEKA